jgi:hypothetical protein
MNAAQAPVSGPDAEAPLPLWPLGLLALGLGAALRVREHRSGGEPFMMG